MNYLLYLIALVLLIIWAIGFFKYDIGYTIHILFFLAMVSVLLKVVRGRDPI